MSDTFFEEVKSHFDDLYDGIMSYYHELPKYDIKSLRPKLDKVGSIVVSFSCYVDDEPEPGCEKSDTLGEVIEILPSQTNSGAEYIRQIFGAWCDAIPSGEIWGTKSVFNPENNRWFYPASEYPNSYESIQMIRQVQPESKNDDGFPILFPKDYFGVTFYKKGPKAGTYEIEAYVDGKPLFDEYHKTGTWGDFE